MREMQLGDIAPIPEYRLCAFLGCYEALLLRPAWMCERHRERARTMGLNMLMDSAVLANQHTCG